MLTLNAHHDKDAPPKYLAHDKPAPPAPPEQFHAPSSLAPAITLDQHAPALHPTTHPAARHKRKHSAAHCPANAQSAPQISQKTTAALYYPSGKPPAASACLTPRSPPANGP